VALPIRTTLEDIDAVCSYLSRKPTGATLAEARAVVDRKHLDGRKLSGLRSWGLIDSDEGKLKITELGRLALRDSGAYKSDALREAVRILTPYAAVVERVVNRREDSLTASEVAAHWHDNFREEVADSETTLNLQALCFFQIAQGADLGTAVIGRRGSATRFQFSLEAAEAFVGNLDSTAELRSPHRSIEPMVGEGLEEQKSSGALADTGSRETGSTRDSSRSVPEGTRIFVSHSGDVKLLEELKQILDDWRVPYVSLDDTMAIGMPIAETISEEMRSCSGAIIVIPRGWQEADPGAESRSVMGSAETAYLLGAASLLYGRKIVILRDSESAFELGLSELEVIEFDNDGIRAVKLDLLDRMLVTQMVAVV